MFPIIQWCTTGSTNLWFLDFNKENTFFGNATYFPRDFLFTFYQQMILNNENY